MIIDAHIHLTADGRWFDTPHDASVDRALREMDKAGVDKAAVIPLADKHNRAFCIETAARRNDRFFAGFTLTSLSGDELDEFRTTLDQGACSFLKVHPRQSGISPANPGLDRFLEVAGERAAPVVFCTYLRGPRVPMNDLTPLVFDGIARRHPNLKIVLAHAGSYRAMDALAVAQSHANVYLDMSHVLEYFRGSSLERDFLFTIRRLDRKVVYGSDFPEYPIDRYLAHARDVAAQIEKSDLTGFFGRRAIELYRCG